MGATTGRCMCGAVRFTAGQIGDYGICHCDACRRWTGSALHAVTVPEAEMRIDAGGDAIGTIRSSGWASRSFCTRCGAPLWYRLDHGTDGAGDFEVAIGLLERVEVPLEREIFVDRKPDCYEIAGDHPRLTEEETWARFGPKSADA
ncbi:Uncharacterized conserved protein [Poseidonocella pacifica]|uniref:Uncharacterized conserved protein n=1 Tax=Poseidonocella pacifica TaxID=871651 RepID=A0A1I0WNY2_9RHOB|nr:GFA family protein [Poseidonocella pacifica]SFA90254.1 Uncharacterized conserved protein [Poseidonocella pacifica]